MASFNEASEYTLSTLLCRAFNCESFYDIAELLAIQAGEGMHFILEEFDNIRPPWNYLRDVFYNQLIDAI